MTALGAHVVEEIGGFLAQVPLEVPRGQAVILLLADVHTNLERIKLKREEIKGLENRLPQQCTLITLI